jgi:MOSC domain-containing protein YiiM
MGLVAETLLGGKRLTELHLPYAVLEERIAALPAPPTDEGRVVLVVVRPETNERLTPSRCQLTPEGGVEGDRWRKRETPNPEIQITLMRADVARVIANGQSLAIPGDNLIVDLDLSSQNLPEGTRLRVGTALAEVTAKPHNGCDKFATRFGEDARAITAAERFKSWRLRGIHVRILEAGDVSPRDAIVVQRP